MREPVDRVGEFEREVDELKRQAGRDSQGKRSTQHQSALTRSRLRPETSANPPHKMKVTQNPIRVRHLSAV